MVNSKLIQVLKTFSSQELFAFRDFVQSPFFNKNQELVILYDYLKKIAPGFSTKKLNRENVYKKIFPRKPYDEKHLNYLMSFLLKLAEKFLALTTFYEDRTAADAYLLETFIRRKLEKHYQQHRRKISSDLEKRSKKDTGYWYEMYRLQDLSNQHFLQQRQRKNDPHIQLSSDYLNLFYLSTKLKLNCEMMDRQRILPVSYNIDHPKELLKLDFSQYEDASILLEIYRLIYTLQEESAEEDTFDQIKELLRSYDSKYQRRELTTIYVHLINYCSQQIRIGNTQYADEALQLYVKGIQQNILLEKGILSPWTFKNVIKLYLGLKMYEDAEAFIKEKHILLAPEFQADAFHFNLADLSYHQYNYDNALKHLNQVIFSDIHYNLGSRVMIQKIYFEQKAIDLCVSQLEAFRIFLLRNKTVPKNIKAPYKNFIDLLHALIKTPQSERSKLKEKILQTQQVIDRPWLLKKTEK